MNDNHACRFIDKEYFPEEQRRANTMGSALMCGFFSEERPKSVSILVNMNLLSKEWHVLGNNFLAPPKLDLCAVPQSTERNK